MARATETRISLYIANLAVGFAGRPPPANHVVRRHRRGLRGIASKNLDPLAFPARSRAFDSEENDMTASSFSRSSSRDCDRACGDRKSIRLASNKVDSVFMRSTSFAESVGTSAVRAKMPDVRPPREYSALNLVDG